MTIKPKKVAPAAKVTIEVTQAELKWIIDALFAEHGKAARIAKAVDPEFWTKRAADLKDLAYRL